MWTEGLAIVNDPVRRMRRSTVILGVPVDDVTMGEAADEIAALIRDGRASGRWHQVTTVNLDFVTNAVRDPDLMGVLQGAALNVPDGMPMLWMARRLGTPLRERVAGVELVDVLAARSALDGTSIHLFGGGPGIAAEAARRLTERSPGATITHGPDDARVSASGESDPAVIAAIRDLRPDIACVALGNPKQERWIARYGPELGASVLIGVGGTLDFVVGWRRRASPRIQRLGLEWVARAAQEPARLGPRYARDVAVCGPRMLAQWWRQRPRRATRRSRPATVAVISPGRLQIRADAGLDLDRDVMLSAASDAGLTEVRVDVGQIVSADAPTIAALVTIARTTPGTLLLKHPTPAFRHALQRAGVAALLLGDDVPD